MTNTSTPSTPSVTDPVQSSWPDEAYDLSVNAQYVADWLSDSHATGERNVKDMRVAANMITELIEHRVAAVMERLPGRPAVLLSGVDSMLVAAALVKAGEKPLAVTCATGQKQRVYGTDHVAAEVFAKHFKLEHVVLTLTEPKMERVAREVVGLLGETDIWEVSAGIAVRACSQHLLRTNAAEGAWWTGGGADVIFGGGMNLDPDADGAVVLADQFLAEEVAKCFKQERYIPDFYPRLLGEHANQYILAFQTVAGFEVAKQLHPSVLWRGGMDKAALRVAAEQLGVPSRLAWRVKSQLQHASGITAALEQQARLQAAKTSVGYTDPLKEPAEMVAARLWLQTLQK